MSTKQASGFPQIPPVGGIARNDATAKFRLGTVIQDVNGNSYRYVKANEAIAIGQLVTAIPRAAWDSGIAIDGAITANTVSKVHIDTITTAMTANQYAGYWIGQAAAAAKGRLYQIKHHAAMAASGEGDLYMEDTIAEAFADNAALEIYHPFLVELTDADLESIAGIGVGTISSGYYGFVQVGGMHPGVITVGGTGGDVVEGELLVPYGSTAGSAQGSTYSSSVDETDLIEQHCGAHLIALDSSTTDTSLIAVKIVGLLC